MTDHDRGGAPASAVSTCGNAKGCLKRPRSVTVTRFPCWISTTTGRPLYGEYASVLASLGRGEEARAQSQKHLEIDAFGPNWDGG
jgi:hypothetical protein